MAEHKLEISKELEDMAAAGTLDSSVAMLNMPDANYCEKRSERIPVGEKLVQSCLGCVTQNIRDDVILPQEEIRDIIDYFAQNHNTRFLTINGRGDPLHPLLKERTLDKIAHAKNKWGIQSYLFTASNNLDQETCDFLADHEVNVMMSLFGNRFIDADFFAGNSYQSLSLSGQQNQEQIAANFRRLIDTYKAHESQPAKGTTRLGMNYVVLHKKVAGMQLSDLGERSETRLSKLKEAANDAGIFFVVNTDFKKHKDDTIQSSLERLSHLYTDFNLKHSTEVHGQCQMGAGSSVTVDYDGTLLRCPYMDNKSGQGKFSELSDSQRNAVVEGYKQDRSHPCVMRPHQE